MFRKIKLFKGLQMAKLTKNEILTIGNDVVNCYNEYSLTNTDVLRVLYDLRAELPAVYSDRLQFVIGKLREASNRVDDMVNLNSIIFRDACE